MPTGPEARSSALLSPFAGLRVRVPPVDRGETLCLPYDCLTPELEEKLRRYPFNAIHLEEPKPRVISGHKTWASWKEQGALERDPESYYLVVEQSDGLRRVGVMALANLALALKTKVIWPHEKCYRRFIDRRKVHFKKMHLHLSPIFLVAQDRQARLAQTLESLAAAKDLKPSVLPASVFDGVSRTLYPISDPGMVEEIRQALTPQDGFLVADGHHRFRAALELARDGGLTHSLCYVTSAESGAGLLKKHPPVPGRNNNPVEPPPLREIIAAAQNGKLFPRKTTYFWPKVPCGLVYAEIGDNR
ncbi:MAG: DUF1015 family protein [Elusimicrobia bacterium]|nr:DUF1015 family protein [Elusimicrobiota bacterium]